MIYLATDDRYFSLGVKAMFSTMYKKVTVLDLTVVPATDIALTLSHTDTLILAVEHSDTLTWLLIAARSRGSNVLLIMDNACERDLPEAGLLRARILPKKMPIDFFPQLFKAGVVNLKDLSFLTTQEMNVMQDLANGKSPCRIAKELDLSVKTISAHKFSAIRKLGLSHLNSRSILIFKLLFDGFKKSRLQNTLPG